MSPPASSAIINWFVEYFSANAEAPPRVLGTIVYEMFGLNDAFGKVMVENMNVGSHPRVPSIAISDYF
jgi:[phosphatase 2A protein]-leucine-carboxy methyltransferase